VLYRLKPLRRVARINGEKSYTHGYGLVDLAIGKDDPNRRRILSSVWLYSNCTSIWNPKRFRIDLARAQTTENILNQEVRAQDGVEMKIEGDTVTFNYATFAHNNDDFLRSGIARYRVQAGRAIRQAPIAPSFGSFIEEWLEMGDTEAGRWSTAEAAMRHHDLAEMIGKDMQFAWEHVAACPRSPPAREITVLWDESKRTTVFLISGARAVDMRMLSISDQPSRSCREIDISDDLSSVIAEPPN
jgi:hypothetical protein